jgi:glycosyltransferase involved in cell wall biosynthesis
MRPEILLFIRSLGRGGAERQLVLLARKLHGMGYNVKVAVLYLEGPFTQELLDAGIPIINFRKGGRHDFFPVLKRIMRYIKANKPLIINSYMPAENVLASCLKPWIRRHGGSLFCGLRIAQFDPLSYGLPTWLLYKAQNLLLSCADGVISNSAKACRELRFWIPTGRCVVVPNGIEVEKFAPSPSARKSQRQAWGLSELHVAIGVVGRLDPQKNHKLALDALARLTPHHPEIRLVIIGEGQADYRSNLCQYATAIGLDDRLIWAGGIGNMAEAYSSLDLLCSASIAEGFPNVVGEAMSAGLPCVVTDVGDCRELVGDCGWVVAGDDPAALANALASAIAQLPHWDADRPRQRIRANFSVEKLAERTLAAYSPYLSRPSS